MGVYFSTLLQIQSPKGQKFKSPAAEQRSSAQGCTVTAKVTPNRVIRGCVASRRVLNISPKVVEGGDPNYPLGDSSCPVTQKDGWKVLRVTM
jgi:hypothetical protein